jgi:hypothetical protein
MANAYRSEVNQRLYFCRLHIESLATLLKEQQIAKSVLEQAFGESVLSHLVLTYRTYLAELALAYAVDCKPPESASQLVDILSKEGHVSAEAKELVALEEQGRWLDSMLQQYHSIGSILSSVKPRASGNFIASSSADDTSVYTLPGLQSYFDHLSELIDNQRTRLEEW